MNQIASPLPRLLAALALAACLAAPGCQTVEDADELGETAPASVAGEPEVLVNGLLDFVNTATLEELDGAAGLNASAAASIVAHRDGDTPSAQDDDPFDTFEELAKVPNVGDTALNALITYLFPDEAAAGAGVWEEVLLDAAQAEAVLEMANHMALGSLDCNAGLSSSASGNIVAARPIADVDALADVRYVGPAALEALRAYTIFWTTDIPVADSFDCVDFTAEQIEIAEEIINTAGYSQLGRVAPNQRDVILFADDHSCRRYLGAAPYDAPCRRSWTSLRELADTPGIGPATMARLRETAEGWKRGSGRPDTIRNFIENTPACDTTSIHVANARIVEAGWGCAWVSDWDEVDTATYRVLVCTNPWDERTFAGYDGYAWTFQARYTDPYFTDYGECVLVDW